MRPRARPRPAALKAVMAVAVCVAMCAAAATAHHSIAGIYDSTQRVTIEGVVARSHFVNPHPSLVVTVSETGGASHDWRLEMDNRFELEAIGMTASTLAPGSTYGDANVGGPTNICSVTQEST